MIVAEAAVKEELTLISIRPLRLFLAQHDQIISYLMVEGEETMGGCESQEYDNDM